MASFMVLFISMPGRAGQHDPRKDLKKSIRLRVVKIIDGDSLILQHHIRVRLVGIEAPAFAPASNNDDNRVMAEKAAKMLCALTLHKFVTLYFGGQRRDRYGRRLAHLFRDDGLWIQGEMLKRGMARVYSFADNRAVIPAMMRREQQARRNNRGLWAIDYFKVKDQRTSAKYHGSFQVITGTVKKVSLVRGTYYLNFGKDWRTDFTVVIKSTAVRKFIKAGINPKSYQGRKIEVRGWLKIYNGPMIEATHPEQIVILTARPLH